MLKFLKSLLRSSPGSAITLAERDVPSWLSDREKEARAVLEAEVAEPVQAIRATAARLQLTVNNLQDADQDHEAHPRIKSIAKNSLPLFLKAMNTSLARELPDDPREFYTAAVECVRGCLNAVRGQGRYLTVALPEEMKEIRTGIDTIGHEINAMTKVLGRFNEEMARIAVARDICSTLSGARAEYQHSFAKEERIRERLAGIVQRLDAIAAETARLSADESLHALDDGRARCAGLGKERDDLGRRYAALTMTASHVLRKAEKIAIRKKLSKEVRILKEAMEILSNHEIATAEEVTGVLDTACPIVQKMIRDGDILLKNREERAVFTDTAAFSAEVSGLCMKYSEIAEQYRKEEEVLLSHPVPARLLSLEREKGQLESMRAHEEQEHRALLASRKERDDSIPRLREDLAKKLGEMRGETVQLQEDEPA
ncbi:hypothetical protein [Methanoregula sp.]|uniref:hypothetical protein n=1 Tax=Methanoregula sp. TaxID=2052170 RepID=UPI002C9973D0|nr:hypothetical protein [Methanoregula sp.]HVP97421.1 hypothetical protein [Methanoregula sp.]